MKTSPRNERAVTGNTLVATIFVTAVVGMVLTAYLSLVRHQNVSVARSQAWNAAMPVIEAGLEDALSHINRNGVTNLGCDGWHQLGNMYAIKRMVGADHYLVTIANCVPATPMSKPVIFSRAYVQAPLLGRPGVASREASLLRAVKVTTERSSLFTKAMVAEGRITFNGNVDTDSFNSEDPYWSTDGQYDPTKTRDNGSVASNGQIVKAIDTKGHVQIRGQVSTGPNGTVGLNGNVSIGSKGWVDGGNDGIEPGWVSDDMNVTFPDVVLPVVNAWAKPSGGHVNGTEYEYVLGYGTWRLGQLNLSRDQAVLVSGDAVLHVVGNITLTGQAYILLAPNARLQLYVGGAASFSGQGVVNGTGQAKNMLYFGLPSNTSIEFSGNSRFVGVIYAPDAEFSLVGGGSDPVDFVGASVTAQVKMSGHYKFHYDESLADLMPKGLVVDSWNEMNPLQAAELTEELAALPFAQ